MDYNYGHIFHVNRNYWRSLVSIVLVLFNVSFCYAFQDSSSILKSEPTLLQVDILLASFNNDSALAVLDEMINTLATDGRLDSEHGLILQTRRAEALEKDDQDERAIVELHKVVQIAKERNSWSALSNAYLSLARLHEKSNRMPACFADLRKARVLINQHRLNTIFARLMVRLSSYYRLSNQLDSARYFAHESVRTAKLLQQPEYIGTGHLLLGIINSRTDFEGSIEQFEKAATQWRITRDFSSYAYCMSNLSSLYLRNQNPNLALAYNDSIILYANIAHNQGNDDLFIFYNTYKSRGEIYQKLGQLDSALHYISLGHALELDAISALNHAEVTEIEHRYLSQQREIQIKNHEELLSAQRKSKYLAWFLLCLALIFFSILLRYYFQLKHANEATSAQTKIITAANRQLKESLNEEQMLHAELHHRVKNNLQIIIGLMERHELTNSADDTTFDISAMTNRIHSIATIHELLNGSTGNQGIQLDTFIKELCDHFVNAIGQSINYSFETNIGAKRLGTATYMPLGIIINELFTNSVKHSNHANSDLKIDIRIFENKSSGTIEFSFKDDGSGFNEAHENIESSGMGLYLVDSMVRQLNGEWNRESSNGVKYFITFNEIVDDVE